MTFSQMKEELRLRELDILRRKAVEVIEFIATLNGTEEQLQPDNPICQAMDEIYVYAHIALGHCDAPHDDWKEKLNQAFDDLQKLKTKEEKEDTNEDR